VLTAALPSAATAISVFVQGTASGASVAVNFSGAAVNATEGRARQILLSPRHRMPAINSRNEGSQCVSMTWRQMYAVP
jgi:hypothetical protein